MRYLIDGCYGDGNVGDEALLRAVCSLIRDRDAEADVVALSSDPETTSRLHGVESVLQTNPFGRGLYGALVRGHLRRIVSQIRRCDCFVLGGGELFRDDVGLRATLGMFYRLWLARAFGKRIVALGVGAQPPTTGLGRAILCRSLRASDAVVFRDRESLAVGRDLVGSSGRLSWCPDLAFALPPLAAAAPPERPYFRLGLSIKEVPPWCLRRADLDAVTEIILAAITELASALPLRVEVIALGLPGRNRARYATSVLAAAGIDTRAELFLDLSRIRSLLAGLDGMLAMPLHASILSLGMGVPSVGLAYDLKVEKLYRQFGLSSHCLPCRTLTRGRLREGLLELTRRAPGLRPHLRRAAEDARRQVTTTVAGVLAETHPASRPLTPPPPPRGERGRGEGAVRVPARAPYPFFSARAKEAAPS